MDDTQNKEQQKRGVPKKLIAIIVVLIVLIGGSIATYAMLSGSDKAQYFKAEKGTIDFMKDQFEDRYEPEMDWSKQSEENPTETTYDLSADYNDPMGFGGGGMMSPEDIINNASLSLTSQTDLDEKQLVTDMKAKFADMEVKDAGFYLDSDQLVAELPFLDESLQIKDEDVGGLLHELEPSFPEDETIDFETFFEMAKGLPDEDRDYLIKEYVTEIYDELPGDAFNSSKETITVDDEKFKTKKLTLDLSEEETKDIIVSIMEKAQDDEKLQNILKKQMEIELFGIDPEAMDVDFNEDIDELFGDQLDDAIEEVKDSHIPDGLTSTIWTKNDLIVKRDLSLSAGENEDDLAKVNVEGTHLLNDTNQKFDYTITGDDGTSEEEAVKLSGDLSWKDDKADDSINLVIDDMELSYNGKETLKDGEREFDREFAFSDGFEDGSFYWSGNASYDKDQMNSENTFSADVDEIDQDTFSLTVAKDAKSIKEVDTPDTSDMKDIGSMSVDEIEDYFEKDVAPQYQEWFMDKMGLGGLDDDEDDLTDL